MRPDEPTVPRDAELAALEADLARAGSAARARGTARPAPAFSTALRARLVATCAAASTADDTLGAAPATTLQAGPAVVAPARLAPRIRRQVAPLFTWRPRLVGGFAAAAAVIAILLVSAPGLLSPAPSLRASDAAAATLTRDGATAPLTPGTALRAGDEIAVGDGGRATLELAGGLARLAPASRLRIERAGGGEVALVQLAGRAWHRVGVPAGTRYVVTSGPVTVTATGTAFDLTREPSAVRVAAVEHAVKVAAPGLAADLPEGRVAIVSLGPAAMDLATRPLGAADLADPWLAANARLDADRGYPVGALAPLLAVLTPAPVPTSPAAVIATPTPGATPVPTIPAPATPEPTPMATLSPTPKPTPRPTAKPTPRPTPKPTPLPTMGLALTTCGGGAVVLDWTAYGGADFNHYTALRSTSGTIAPTYPPTGGATAVASTYLTDPGLTVAIDAGLDPVTWYYRAMAFGADDRTLAASAVVSVVAKPTKSLGTLAASAPGPGALELAWTPYGGGAACFTYYKLVYSTDGSDPSYPGGSPYFAALGDLGTGSWSGTADPGVYRVRVQAILATEGGPVVVAQTSIEAIEVLAP